MGDPLTDVGWVDTATAERAVLGVSVARLLEYTARAELDGVWAMVGWTRLSHVPSLPGWWAAQRVESRPPARARRDAHAGRVRGLVAGGVTVAAAAAEQEVLTELGACSYQSLMRRQRQPSGRLLRRWPIRDELTLLLRPALTDQLPGRS